MASHPFLNGANPSPQPQDPFELLSAHWNADTEETLCVAGVGVGAQQSVGAKAPLSVDKMANSSSNGGDLGSSIRETKFTYKDHMNDPDGDYMAPSDVTLQATGSGNTGADQSFPVRLHYMLSEMEKDGLSHIVSWQPHGRCKMSQSGNVGGLWVLSCCLTSLCSFSCYRLCCP